MSASLGLPDASRSFVLAMRSCKHTTKQILKANKECRNVCHRLTISANTSIGVCRRMHRAISKKAVNARQGLGGGQ